MELSHNYIEVPCQKPNSGEQFSRGLQQYLFSVGGRNGFIPRHSYFRAEIKLEQLDGGGAATVPPTLLSRAKQTALADNVCGNLYNNAYFRMGGTDASSITSFLPQCSALKQRVDKSGAWLDKIGRGAYWSDANFERRRNKTQAGGVECCGERIIKIVGEQDATVAVVAPGDPGNVTFFNADARELEVGDVVEARGGDIRLLVVASGTQQDGTVSCNLKNLDGTPAPNVAATEFQVVKKSTSSSFFVVWQPPLGIFDEDTPLGSGDYRIELNPNPNFEKAAIESLYDLQPNVANSYKLTIGGVRFYAAMCKTDLPPSMTTELSLCEMVAYTKPIQSISEQLDFTVPASTECLTVLLQSASAGTTTRLPPSKFKFLDGSDEDVRGLQITYGNETKPSTRFNSKEAPNEDQMQQRYHDVALYTGLLYSSGGMESYNEWKQRGQQFSYAFSRDKDDRSTYVNVRLDLGSAPPAGSNLILVAHYNSQVQVETQSGFVTSVIRKNV